MTEPVLQWLVQAVSSRHEARRRGRVVCRVTSVIILNHKWDSQIVTASATELLVLDWLWWRMPVVRVQESFFIAGTLLLWHNVDAMLCIVSVNPKCKNLSALLYRGLAEGGHNLWRCGVYASWSEAAVACQDAFWDVCWQNESVLFLEMVLDCCKN